MYEPNPPPAGCPEGSFNSPSSVPLEASGLERQLSWAVRCLLLFGTDTPDLYRVSGSLLPPVRLEGEGRPPLPSPTEKRGNLVAKTALWKHIATLSLTPHPMLDPGEVAGGSVCHGAGTTPSPGESMGGHLRCWQLALARACTRSLTRLCNPMDHSPPGGSSVHGTLQARILEWVATSYSRGSSRPRD